MSGKLPLGELPRPPENYPQKNGHEKITPQKITPYEYSLMKAPPVKTTPQKFVPQKIALYENLRPWENYPPLAPPHTYKSYQNYKIFGLEESCATQHPYQNNQGPLWYTDDLTENTGLRYFLYRMKKIQKSNESKNRQMGFTCKLYKSRRTKTR